MDAKYKLFFALIIVQTIRAATCDSETIIRNPNKFLDRLLFLKNRINFCDAEIAVVNIRIPVHRIILASSSEYFEKVFTENESQTEIELFDMDVETALSLIEYCYTGIISVSEKNLHKIMSAATFLEIAPIIEDCKKILEEKIDSSNCTYTSKLAKSKHYENFMNKSFEYIRQNYEKISSWPEFLDLDYSEIVKILRSDIAVKSETIVFNSVKKWISHDSASRLQYLCGLSEYIKFEYLPKTILLSEFHDLCSKNSSPQCHAKILNALQQKEKNNFESADNCFRDTYSTLIAIGTSLKFGSAAIFELFDLRNEKWIKIENFQYYRQKYSVVLLEDKLMFIGGHKNDSYNYENMVQIYDLNTGVMENLAPLKYVGIQSSAVEFKGRVFVITGYNVEMWDSVMEKWVDVTRYEEMSLSRQEYQAQVLGEEIVIVGGNFANMTYVRELECFNPVTGKWKKLASMNERRRIFHGVAVVDGYLYILGGKSSLSFYLNTVERYDPKTNKWKMIHSMNDEKYAMGAANFFGKLVVVGGMAKKHRKLSTVEMYDDENDKWISMRSLNDPQWFSKVLEIPWRLAMATILREVPK